MSLVPDKIASTPPEPLIDELLRHVARYRLTVFPALEGLPAFSGLGPRRIKELLRSARQQKLIASAPLHHGAAYWHLDTDGALRLGLGEERIGPLSEPAKIRALALLRFCCISDPLRTRLTTEEITQSFPDLYRPGLPSGYYVDPSGAGHLGLARVDAGRRGRWDRVLQQLRTDLSDHLRRPGFRRLAQAGRFELTILTAFRQKARRIYESLADLPQARRIPVQVVAMPELLPLLSSMPLKGASRRAYH